MKVLAPLLEEQMFYVDDNTLPSWHGSLDFCSSVQQLVEGILSVYEGHCKIRIEHQLTSSLLLVPSLPLHLLAGGDGNSSTQRTD
jgi:hypothetical protein